MNWGNVVVNACLTFVMVTGSALTESLMTGFSYEKLGAAVLAGVLAAGRGAQQQIKLPPVKK